MQNEASKRRRFGQPEGNQRKRLPRLGVVIGRQRLKRLREVAVMQAEIKGLGEFEGDSIDLFRSVYKNLALPLEVRLQAAARVAQFERPLLAATAISNNMTPGLADRLNAAIARVSRAGDGDPVALLAADERE